MPTPFSHLEIAQRLLADTALPETYRALIHKERPAFLLGSIAADARVGNGSPRDVTHFYAYGDFITERVWRVMTRKNPTLMTPKSDPHRAFIAGYVAHITVDENWTMRMVNPHFIDREWADRMHRFFILHILLCYMDARDLDRLQDWHANTLKEATPVDWLPFIADEDLITWQQMIYDQVKPGGHARTLEIFGGRIGKTVDEMQTVLESPQIMQAQLWAHIPQATLQTVEDQCYIHARQEMIRYLDATES